MDVTHTERKTDKMTSSLFIIHEGLTHEIVQQY